MKFMSFVRFFGKRWLRGKARRTRLTPRPERSQLLLEALEQRVMPVASTPRIVAVTPPDFSNVGAANPTITVRFSEAMDAAEVTTSSNYELFNTAGKQIAPLNVSYDVGTLTATVTISNQLPAGAYTLFLRGDLIYESTDTFPLSQPGQIVVANMGESQASPPQLGPSTVSTINVANDGTLNTVSSFPQGPSSAIAAPPPSPLLITVADFNGNGINDAAVVNTIGGVDTLSVYDGLKPSAANPLGGFASTPSFSVQLPAGAKLDVPVAMLAFSETEFAVPGVNGPDIGITDKANDRVIVFPNVTALNGPIAFGAPVLLAVPAGMQPVGLVAADFNFGHKLDLATVGSLPNGNGQQFVYIFAGNGRPVNAPTAAPSFNAFFPDKIFDPQPKTFLDGIQFPTGLAAGLLVNNSQLPDIAIIGTGPLAVSGVETQINMTPINTNNFAFATGLLDHSQPWQQIAIGQIDQGPTPTNDHPVDDLVVSDDPSLVLRVYVNSGDGVGFTPHFYKYSDLSTPTTAVTEISSLILADLSPSSPAVPVPTVGGAPGSGNVSLLIPDTSLTTDTVNGFLVFKNAHNAGITADHTPGSAPDFAAPVYYQVDNDPVAITVGNGGESNLGAITIFENGGQIVAGRNGVGTNGGDVNGDGIPDVVTANTGFTASNGNKTGRSITVARGVGDATFLDATTTIEAPGGTLSAPLNPSPDGIAIGDLNGDGILDYVVADAGMNQVEVYLGIAPAKAGGPATYAAPATYTISAIDPITKKNQGLTPVSVILADLTGTGKLDIVTADNADNFISILANKGDGTFGASTLVPVGQGPTQIIAGLFNTIGGKKSADLIVAHNGTGSALTSRGVTVLINNNSGNRTFVPAVEYGSGKHVTAVAAGDFNADGNLEFAFTDGPLNGTGSLIVMLGDGTGNFTQTAAPFPVAANPSTLAVADINRDGFPDIIVGSQSSNPNTAIGVLLNTVGDGFRAPVYTALPNGTPVNSITVTDLPYTVSSTLATDLSTIQNFVPLVSAVGFPPAGGFNIQVDSEIMKVTAVTGTTLTVVRGVNGTTAATHMANAVVTANNLYNPFPDLVVGTFPVVNAAPIPVVDNVFTLQGIGDGTFVNALPYEAGGPPSPTTVNVISNPLIHVVSFFMGGTLISGNLVQNGNFDIRDLNNEQGNLVGWQTTSIVDSHGGWDTQTATTAGSFSPLSQVQVPNPDGLFQGMVDEPNLQPLPLNSNQTNPNAPSTYQGSHFLYQDVTIPANASSATLSLRLTIYNGPKATSYSTGSANASLDYRSTAPDQQVRVDIMDPTASITTTTVHTANTPGVYLFPNPGQPDGPVFLSDQGTPLVTTVPLVATADLTALAGKTVRIRIATVNNQDQLIVGVDNVNLQVLFNDTGSPSNVPTITGLHLRNPGFGSGSPTTPTTTDTTIVGQVGDDGGLGNVEFIAFDPNPPTNGVFAFNGPNVFKTNYVDAQGNFSAKLPILPPGLNTIGVRVQDFAGNQFDTSLQFINQIPGVTNWQAVGPGAVDTTSEAGITYSSVTGRVTAVATDPSDPSGTTYYVGSANGGVWKTTDGGNNWTPLTDNITDQNGQPVNVPIGAIAVAASSPSVVYAATGTGDTLPDSRGSIGILRSFNGGAIGSWTVVGTPHTANYSGTVFANARITAMAVDQNSSNIVYVAVAAGGAFGPGVYRTLDGGNTWTAILDNANMNTAVGGNPIALIPPGGAGSLPAGTTLASITSLVIDPRNSHDVTIGLGNIGLVPNSITAGVWKTSNADSTKGPTFTPMLGGDNVNIKSDTLPSDLNNTPATVTIGRVTVGQGYATSTTGPGSNIATFYVLMGNPSLQTPPVQGGSVDFGNGDPTKGGKIAGLYKSPDGGLDWTRVMLRTNTGTAGKPVFQDLNLLGNDANNVGAIVLDQTDPNVVYVGGADNVALSAGLVRVDTGNMRDVNWYNATAADPGTATTPGLAQRMGVSPTSPFVDTTNDGDDLAKITAAIGNGGGYPNGGGVYKGEGVSWYDLESNSYSPSSEPVPSVPAPRVSGFAAFSTAGPLSRLPASVQALALDAGGRLIIGTHEGVWRAVYHGTGYDYTSGQTGIVATTNQAALAPVPSVTITTINGNLQIAELTSVAADPVVGGQFFASSYDTGTMTTTGGLNWTTMGLNGPASATQNPTRSPSSTFDAGVVLVGAPDPTAPAGTPTTVYRDFAYILKGSGYFPETNTQNGDLAGWGAAKSAGISITDNAGYFPVLAIDPTKIFNSGVYQDLLLFGTDRIYTTFTSSNLWDDRVGHPLSIDPTSYVTAAAVAPSNTGVFYAGTNNGELFVSLNNGANWPQTGVGVLPKAPVTGIAVDPTNPQVAIATFGSGVGSISHVWRTANGGKSWQSITGNLPAVNANAVVIDAHPALNSLTGKVYLATDVGVYVTLNNGASWTRVGNSLPNAPVTNLQLTASQNVLAAASQGRGVFSISTAQLSPIADQIINTNTTTGALGFTVNTIGVPLGSFTVSVSSDNQAVIPNANIVLGGTDATNNTITVTPVTNADTFSSAPVTITITLTDSLNQKFTETFHVTVLGNLIIQGNGSRSFLIGVADTSTVTASSSDQTIVPNNNIVITGASAGERRVTVTPTPNQAGTLLVTLTITDPTGLQKKITFPVQVNINVVGLPFFDNFNRTSPNFLGAAWSDLTGHMAVQANAATVELAGSPNGAAIDVLNGVVRSDVSLDVDVALPVGGSGGLIARQSGAGDTNLYLAQLSRTASGYIAQICRVQNGSIVPLATADVSGFAGVGLTTTIRFDVIGTSLKMYVGTGPNLALAVYATDATLQSGAVGLRGTPNAGFDDFVALDVPVASPTLPFTDSFATGGPANQLSTNWEDRSGHFAIVGGGAQGSPLNGSGADNVSILRGANDADVILTADVNVTAGNDAGLIARYSGAADDTMYLGVLANNGGTPTAQILRSTGPGTWLVLNQAPAPNNAGTLRFVVIGDALQLFLGNTLLTFATDNVLTQGSVGIRGSATSFTNFAASPAPVVQTTLPFSDDFTSSADAYGQPQANWLIRQGDFQVSGGAALGQDPRASDHSPNNPSHVNLAVLAGLNVADVNASLAIAANAGDQAGLVARYQDDNNYYLGVLDNTGNGPVAAIWRVVGGVPTQLAAAAPPDTQGTLQFTVVGSSLQLSLNGNLVVSARDTHLTSGSIGVRTSATPFGAFSASAVSPVLPYSDNFSSGSNLGPAWSVETGGFTEGGGGGTATGVSTTGPNLATLPGVNTADVVLAVDFNVNFGQYAGLVARYSGPADSNMYIGMINDSTGTPTAQIIANIGGQPTVLGQAAATVAAGTLQFQVVGSSLRLFVNGTLRVVVRDTNLMTGAVGIRGSATTFANFSAAVAPAGLPFTDSFSTSGSLSNSWLNEAGTFAVGSGTANGQNPVNLATLPGVNAHDVVVAASVNVASGQQAGLIARHSALGDSSYYFGVIDNTSGRPVAKIIRNVGGVAVVLKQATIAATSGTLQFEVVGSSLRLFLSNTLLVSATDSTLASGSVGMRASVTSLDNFSATLYVPTTAVLPFTDDFTNGNAQGQLANTWTSRVGDFIVAGGVATGTDTANLAVLGGVNVADVTATATIALATGQQAALVTHYNGSGDNSMYLGVIDNTTGSPVAQIVRVSATGQKTLLGQAKAPSASGILSFRIAGSALRLSLGGALLIDVTDANPLAAGSVGIRGSATTFDNFNATQTPPVVNGQPTITSSEHTTFTESQAGLFTVTTFGTPTPSLVESGSLPTNVTFQDNGDGTATLSGTPAPGTHGTYQFTITAHNGIGSDYIQNFTLTVALPSFSYDPATKILTITGSNFVFSQASTADVNGIHTTYTFTMDGTQQTYPDTALSRVIVNGQGTSATAILITNDTYVDTQGATQETHEGISLGSRTDAGVGTIQKLDGIGNPFNFLTLSNFPISYAYAGRNDGTVLLYGTAGVPYNGFVTAGNYSYMGGPGLFHLAQGASSVYGYSAGQAADFAYHYSANPGSAFVVSGVAFSYMSTTDTVKGVTLPYFNVAAGFIQNTGVSKNPGKDFAYIIDSPGNDTFVGGDAYSFMYSTNASGAFTEFDAAYAFTLVFGQSFVGGFDVATNAAPARNILAGFHVK